MATRVAVQHLRIRHVCLCVLIMTLAVGRTCPRAAADAKETEARLEAADVDEPTREGIHGAIERATKFLISQQQDDGSFKEHWEHGDTPTAFDPIRTTLLCALALRHVGTEPTREPAQRAVAWALAQGPECWGAIGKNVQSAALALMLRDAMRDVDLPVEATATALADAIDEETGYWSFALQSEAGRLLPSIEDSQFAVLGLWAARKQGAAVPAEVWIRHARALGEEQTSSGSWRWHPSKTLGAMGYPPDPSVDTGVPVGRYTGLASLRLASEALKESRAGQSVLKRTVKRAMRRVDSETAEVLADPADTTTIATDGTGREWRFPRRQGSPGRPGRGAYQKLWAMSQAFIFNDVEHYKRAEPGSRRAKKRPWYVDAVEWLLRVQDASGGWSPTAGMPVTPSSETDTAYAVLFLVRSAATMHPSEPRPVDATPPGQEAANN